MCQREGYRGTVGAGYPRIIWIKIPVFQWPMDLYPYTDCTTRIVKFKFNILFPFFTFLSTIKYTEHFEIFECTTVEHFIIRQRQRRHIFRISRGIVRET